MPCAGFLRIQFSVRYRELVDSEDGERSCDIRRRVDSARDIQKQRYESVKKVHANAHIGPRAIKKYCRIDEDGKEILQRSIDSFGFSARAYHRILKVSRTIADLEGEEYILARHISEAVQYRTLDRNLWMR